jgi:hypothetical protein
MKDISPELWEQLHVNSSTLKSDHCRQVNEVFVQNVVVDCQPYHQVDQKMVIFEVTNQSAIIVL